MSAAKQARDGHMLILLVEDNLALAANIGQFLEAEGETVDYAHNGRAALGLALTQRYDVIALDLGLPGLDGLALCRRLRDEYDGEVPILMLTGRGTLEDKLAGFAAGADDYLTKPFDLDELHVRMQALARRGRRGARRRAVADLEYDSGSRTARRAGQVLRLTPIGLRILDLLMRRSPAAVPHADIEQVVWGDDPPERGASLRVHMHALRVAVDGAGQRPLLHTVHGFGYRLGDDGPA